VNGKRDSEKDTDELDDVADRDELRSRYDMLLQEVRVALPGVQVLVAFLMTVAFSQRFGELDQPGKVAYGIALSASMLSVILLLGPSLLHHVGERTARSQRLEISIVLLLGGVAALGVALLSALWGVSRFVFGDTIAWLITAPIAAMTLVVWVVLPRVLRRRTTTQA